MIELKVDFGHKIKRLVFLDKDEAWAIKQKKVYEHNGFPVDLVYKEQNRTISIKKLFRLLNEIVDEGKEHASEILPELEKRIWGENR